MWKDFRIWCAALAGLCFAVLHGASAADARVIQAHLSRASSQLQAQVSIVQSLRSAEDQQKLEITAETIDSGDFVALFRRLTQSYGTIPYVTIEDTFDFSEYDAVAHRFDLRIGFRDEPAVLLKNMLALADAASTVNELLEPAGKAILPNFIDGVEPKALIARSPSELRRALAAWAAEFASGDFARNLKEFQIACDADVGGGAIRLVSKGFSYQVGPNRKAAVEFPLFQGPAVQIERLAQAAARCKSAAKSAVSASSASPEGPAPDNHTAKARVAEFLATQAFKDALQDFRASCRPAFDALSLSGRFSLADGSLSIDANRSNDALLSYFSAKAADCRQVEQAVQSILVPGFGTDVPIHVEASAVMVWGAKSVIAALAKWRGAFGHPTDLPELVYEARGCAARDLTVWLGGEVGPTGGIDVPRGGNAARIELNLFAAPGPQVSSIRSSIDPCSQAVSKLDQLNSHAVEQGLLFVEQEGYDTTSRKSPTAAAFLQTARWIDFFLGDATRIDGLRDVIRRSDVLSQAAKFCVISYLTPARYEPEGDRDCGSSPVVHVVSLGYDSRYDVYSKWVELSTAGRPQVPDFIRMN